MNAFFSLCGLSCAPSWLLLGRKWRRLAVWTLLNNEQDSIGNRSSFERHFAVSHKRLPPRGMVRRGRAPVAATVSFSGAATLDSACTEAREYRHSSNDMTREAERSSITKLLKRALPEPLQRHMRGAALFVVPSLRRRLTRTWRRRNRLIRRLRGTRNRLRRRVQRFLSDVWRRQLKQRLWLTIWRIDLWRRGNRPLESNNQIHLISSLWERIELGNAQRTLHLFDELKDHADVRLWTELHRVPPE